MHHGKGNGTVGSDHLRGFTQAGEIGAFAERDGDRQTDTKLNGHLSTGHSQHVRQLPHGDAVVPEPVGQRQGVQGQSQDGAGVVPQGRLEECTVSVTSDRKIPTIESIHLQEPPLLPELRVAGLCWSLTQLS